ncbi:PAS domain S-box protein [Pleionea sp. CnH1-48]|uniref:PAS domain-containing sensor histidine kinase n=1 Tax=Pleionea sp. CnH1-48 TaxID=2954494 RepID=UPI002097A313|nr:PAS domain S-box protein [Pleionea sp. CnH1-48]MCO7226214.1 PAS domain S-box protein [Pleionea sp. CnH1-48]
MAKSNKYNSLQANTFLLLFVALLLPVAATLAFDIYLDGDVNLTQLITESTIAASTIIIISYPLYQLLLRINQVERRRSDTRKNVAELMDHAADMIFIMRPDGTIIDANQRAVEILGYSKEELLNASTWDLDIDCYMRRHPDLHRRLYQGQSISFESQYRSKDGANIPIESHITMAGWLDEPHYFEIARDITRRRKAEQELYASKEALERVRNRLENRVQERTEELVEEMRIREQAERSVHEMRHLLENLVNSMPSIIIALDANFRVTQWNQEAERILNIRAVDAIGNFITQILPSFRSAIVNLTKRSDYGRKAITRRLSLELNQQLKQFEVMLYPLTPTKRSGSPGVVIRIDDITEKVRIDEMLVQTEKMLSLGGLAAGMAHEINNPLGAILQSSQNIQRRLSVEFPRNQKVAKQLNLDLNLLEQYLAEQKIPLFIDAIREAGERAAHIVGDMLSFSRPSQGQNAAIDVTHSLESARRLAAKDYNQKKKFDFRNIHIHCDYQEHLPPVLAQKNQLEQVFLNLLINAAQAMAQHPEVASPTITLKTRLEGQAIRVDITDNGPGMDEHIRRRVFEPFFTTKEEGAGTGLGLSVSYFIITEQLGGQMMLKSAPGHGTSFSIYLPIQGDAVALEEKTVDGQVGQIELPLNSE